MIPYPAEKFNRSAVFSRRMCYNTLINIEGALCMRLLCFGDSNTYGYDPRSFPGDRYPADVRWTDVLARTTGWEVVNAGQNGREIPRRPAELTRADRLLAGTGPLDLLAVMLGSNDLLQNSRFTAVDAAGRMEAFLAHLLEGCAPPPLLLIAPPPMRPGAWVTEERLLTESAGLADSYEALARRLGIRLADAGRWGVELLFDGVHFSEAGHRAFAARMQAVLEGITSPGLFSNTSR